MKLCHFIAFAGGALVGGTIVWIMTSRKGEELRKCVMNRLGDAKNSLAQHMGQCCNDGAACNGEKEE